MTDVTQISSVQKGLIQSNNDLAGLINRVNQLQSEHKKFEHKNYLTQEKVNKVIQQKKNLQEIKEKQTQYQEDKLYEQQVRYAHIQQLRSDVHDERQAMFQALHEQKSQEYMAAKQQSLQSELKLRDVRQQENSRRREQADKIQRWKLDQRESLQQFWEQKVNNQRLEQDQNKKKQIQQTLMQNKAIDQLEKVESELLTKLKNTQQVSQDLADQLNQALTQPQNLVDFYPTLKQQNGLTNYKSEQNWQKKIQSSPYVTGLPNIVRNKRLYKEPKSVHNLNMGDQQDTNPSQISIRQSKLAPSFLPIKPSKKEQKVQVDRLYQSKKQFIEKIEILRQKDFDDQTKSKSMVISKTQNVKKFNTKFQFKKKSLNVGMNHRGKNNNSPSRKQPDEDENYQENDQEFNDEDQNDEYEEDQEKIGTPQNHNVQRDDDLGTDEKMNHKEGELKSSKDKQQEDDYEDDQYEDNAQEEQKEVHKDHQDHEDHQGPEEGHDGLEGNEVEVKKEVRNEQDNYEDDNNDKFEDDEVEVKDD